MARLDPQSLPQHVNRLYRAAWALCGSPHDAEDLVQETFARVLARPRQLRGQDELAYLMRVLRNTFLTQRRTASRRPQNARVSPEEIDAADPRTGERPEQVLQAKEVFSAIALLPDNYRLALVAVDVVGLSYREAAKALGTREATIATRVFRARERVAKELTDEPAAEGKPREASDSPGVLCNGNVAPTTIMTEPSDNDIQQRTAALIASIEIEAPASLHGFVRGHILRAQPRQRVHARRRAILAGVLAGAAALALVLVLALGSSTSGGPTAPPTVVQAAALGLRPATLAAPEENPHARGQLAIANAGIAYPYWGQRFGWQSAGVRTDRLGGRTVTTVFYTSPHGRRIGYAIVAGPALAQPNGAHIAVWRGTRFYVLHPRGATMVTWRRADHTCILIATGVSVKTLLTLANWQAT